jgi:hypothetical protein
VAAKRFFRSARVLILSFALGSFVVSLVQSSGQAVEIGDPWGINVVKLAGNLDANMPDPSVAYDPNTAYCIVTAAGHDIWDEQDGCAFAYTAVDGDFDIIVRVDSDFLGPATNPWGKAGVMVRDSLAAGSKYVFYLTSRGNGNAMIQWRDADDQAANWPGFADFPPYALGLTYPFYLRLSRSGGTFTGYYSADGQTWTEGSSHSNPEFVGILYVGLALTSHEETVETTMTFSHFSLGESPPALPTWYVDGAVSASGDGTSMRSALKTIQEGIDKASDGQTVLVAPRNYVENIRFNGKNIVLRTLAYESGPRAVIDGNQAGSVVMFDTSENGLCLLMGFTITNGRADYGGGIRGGRFGYYTRAGILFNTVAGNSVVFYGGGGIYGCDGLIAANTVSGNAGGSGGGLSQCGGIIQNDTITGNSVTSSGGGLLGCNGTIQNNTITGNSALFYGGGLSVCDGTIQNNTITGNSAESGGGGLYLCNGAIRNNTITGNSGGYEGGGLSECRGTIQNNTVRENSATGSGGGFYNCGAIIQNNTIMGNSAEESGGGLYRCHGRTQNCIIWANTAPTDPQLDESSMPTYYCCIQDWSGGGEGNTASEPRFLDLNAGDCRLQEGSPCIDAGYNDPALPATDIVGMHRIMYGGKSLAVDMGAYEFYINNLTRGPNPDQTTFIWSSLADKTYSIFYSDDLINWHVAIANFPSSGNQTTSWLDDGSLTGLPPGLSPKRFYRILENP